MLDGATKARYEKAHHDKTRYSRYNDDKFTRHGGVPKEDASAYEDAPPGASPPFHHRGEHDVESIYWSLVCAILRVNPRGYRKARYATGVLKVTWNYLNSHEIPNAREGKIIEDARNRILNYPLSFWRELLPNEMRDVATLMYDVSRHIRSEYALWDWDDGKYDEAHLHEAFQRLILQYLANHPDDTKNVTLDPHNLRPNEIPSETTEARLGLESTAASSSKASADKTGSKTCEGKGKGMLEGSMQTEIVPETPLLDILLPKGKRGTTSQGGRSLKRLKDASGSTAPTRESYE